MDEINPRVAETLTRIRAKKPLIHHITNFVVMNDTANVTLHLGALPVMAHAAEEVAEMIEKASALVLNTGTPAPERVEAMLIAGRRANELGIPIVLDPVGVGATTFRTQTNLRLLDKLKIAIVRGNAGEIGALSGTGGVVKGVESIASGSDPITVAQGMAQARGLVVAVTGKRDIISAGERILGVDNGHAWLRAITGAGCMATTVIAAFAAVEGDYLLAATGALATYGLAAELAAAQAHGPASFKTAFFDQLYNLTSEQVAEGACIVELTSKT
jgi:hydroxyethylthiazole kinase